MTTLLGDPADGMGEKGEFAEEEEEEEDEEPDGCVVEKGKADEEGDGVVPGSPCSADVEVEGTEAGVERKLVIPSRRVMRRRVCVAADIAEPSVSSGMSSCDDSAADM